MFNNIKPGDVIKATRYGTDSYLVGIVIKEYPTSDNGSNYFIKILYSDKFSRGVDTSNWRYHDITDKTGKYLLHRHYSFERLTDAQTCSYIIQPCETKILVVNDSKVSSAIKERKLECFRVSTGVHCSIKEHKVYTYATVTRNDEFSGIAISEISEVIDLKNLCPKEIVMSLIKVAYAREEQIRMKVMEEKAGTL